MALLPFSSASLPPLSRLYLSGPGGGRVAGARPGAKEWWAASLGQVADRADPGRDCGCKSQGFYLA